MTRHGEDDERDDRDPAALGHLSRSEAPPALLEDRVVAALKAEGLLAPQAGESRAGAGIGRGGRLRAAALVLALPAAFLAGLAAGGWASDPGGGPPARDAIPRFVLLLFEDAAYRGPAAGEMGARVQEYAAWARSLGEAGVKVTGEKLGDEAMLLGAPATPGAGVGEGLTGYFVLGAPDRERVLELARGCPHLKYGGRIVVRPIDPT